ncbi:MAG TPA: DMT family transporter, partial [Spirochaetota bacterium]|nr:DMT family transporter [Spirochaetota bacterium]
IGGCLGAFYVASCIVIANKVGALSLVALILAGQMIASLILDHFGLIGYKVQPISFLKIAGILLIVAGIYCIRIG